MPVKIIQRINACKSNACVWKFPKYQSERAITDYIKRPTLISLITEFLQEV